MFPLFIGPEGQALYGVCHEPEPSRARPLGVVVCQPILHEAADARRALRALGDLLAAEGVAVLRFDYFGTGNSFGEQAEGTVERWTQDIGLAVDELKALRGLTDVGLVGLRFGASLAALAAAQREDVRFLALWEPVVQGELYVESLRQLQGAWLAHETRERPGARLLATEDEVVGFPFPAELRDGLAGIDLRKDAPAGVARTLIVDESIGGGLDVLKTTLRTKDGLVDKMVIDGGQVWQREFDAEQSQVPRELLAEIVAWVLKGSDA